MAFGFIGNAIGAIGGAIGDVAKGVGKAAGFVAKKVPTAAGGFIASGFNPAGAVAAVVASEVKGGGGSKSKGQPLPSSGSFDLGQVVAEVQRQIGTGGITSGAISSGGITLRRSPTQGGYDTHSADRFSFEKLIEDFAGQAKGATADILRKAASDLDPSRVTQLPDAPKPTGLGITPMQALLGVGLLAVPLTLVALNRGR